MARNKKTKNHCPYWSDADRRCTVRNNGLFIPLDDHIALFCTAPNYPKCQQYAYALSTGDTGERTDRSSSNRRRHNRIRKRLLFNIVRLNEAGNIVQHFAGMTSSIDLSLGGMQINIRDPLIRDAIVNLSFGKSFPPSLQSCLARVEWCSYARESMSYKAGLSFEHEQTAKAVHSCFDVN